MALDIIHVIPGLPWASPLPALFTLAIHLVDGLEPCTCPCHSCCIIAVSCCVVSCHVVSSLHHHHVVSHHHCVIVIIVLSPCCCVMLRHCGVIVIIALLLCHIMSLSSLYHCHHCVVVVVTLLQSSCGEHRAAGLRAGTGRPYSITWNTAAIVSEH